MSDILKKLIDKAVEVAADPVLSVELLTSVSTEIKKKYGSSIISSGVYQDKKTKMKMVIAVGKIDGVRFIYQINEDGSYVASINSKILETKGLALTTVGAVLVTVNRVVERAKITAKAINNVDVLKDKIVIGAKEEASFITWKQVKEAGKKAKSKETASNPIKGTFTLNNNYFFFSVEGSSFRYSIISKDLYVDENSDTKKIKENTTFDLAIMHATTYALNKKLNK